MSVFVPVPTEIDAPHRHGLVLGSLFTDSANTELVEQVMRYLPLGDISRFIRVNRITNEALTPSSSFQLRYRTAFHAIPSPCAPPWAANFPHPDHVPLKDYDHHPDNRTSSSEKLARLLEREERLDTLNPSPIRCIHVPDATVHEVKDGYILASESIRKTPIIVPQDGPKPSYKLDGFNVWKHGTSEGSDQKGSEEGKRAAFRLQGVCGCRTDIGFDYDAVAMCPEDNVIAVTHKMYVLDPLRPSSIGYTRPQQEYSCQ
ncbi:hypothetical protein I317_06919 [Kwoniella heveanensis CBS 569]|nr:hypothetical protein I317_06919 [Kwoniella heveanensis CBS 569]